MIRFFLDTNVVIDFLADRKPFSEEATKLFDYCYKKKIEIYISSLAYSNIYFVLRQSKRHSDTIKLLDELSELTEIADVTKAMIRKSFKSDFKDFEDAIQYNCALSIDNLNAIVTRDAKDFRKSSVAVLTPKEAVSMVEL
jgi:predicted nucleic acid-binding protein